MTKLDLLAPKRIQDPDIPDTLITENGFRPAWLLSPYISTVWSVASIGSQQPQNCVFNVTVPGGGNLQDYPNLYDSIRKIAFGVRTGPLADVNHAGVHAGIVSNLTTLACWMIANGIERFSQITRGDINEYAKVAVYGTHTILNTEAILERHLESLIDLAEFDKQDSEDDRIGKAAAVFPCLTRLNGIPYALNRSKIFDNAGLASVGMHSRGSVLALLMDETEVLCGFRPSVFAKKRAKNPTRDDFDDKPVSEEHLRRFLMSFQYLWDHRRYLDDAMSSNPFPFTSARREARKLGAEVGRTGTVPVEQATHLIERSIRWVLDYSLTILDLKDWLDTAHEDHPHTAVADFATKLSALESWPTGPSNPFPLVVDTSHIPSSVTDEMAYAQAMRGGMSIRAATEYLVIACAVVIAAFSARRAAEIGGLKAGCTFSDDSGNSWMKCFIHKTLQSESFIPIPEVVVVAVQVLERLSKGARELTGTPYVFQYKIPGTNTIRGISASGRPNFNFNALLRRFGYIADIPALPDGTRWTFKPHQFRRFFAILYIWVYDRGDWGALQHHLRHFTHEMTRRYVSEDSIGQIIAVADKEHTAEILANAEIGVTQIGGIEGTRLKEVAQRIHAKLAQNVEVVSERKLKQRIMRYIDRSGITLKAFPWGFCVERKNAEVQHRNCSATTSPNYVHANEGTCAGCAFNMLTPSHQPFLTQAIRFHEEIANSTDTPHILKAASMALHKKLSDSLSSIQP